MAISDLSNSRPFSSPQILLQSADLNSHPHLASCKTKMDISGIAKKLGFSDSKLLIQKAAEVRRLCDVHFDSSVIGVGEVAKAIICFEIAATKLGVLFDRSSAVRLSGMSERAYSKSYNSLNTSIGVKLKLDVRELAIQFGCIRIVPLVRDGLKLYKERYLSSLPASRRASADFARPVFTAAAFYLCARKHKMIKVDKIRLIELCGTSESEFSSVSNTMKDLCHDVFGVAKEKKDPKEVKANGDSSDVLPNKRKPEDGGYLSVDDGLELPSYKKRKRMESCEYEEWKSSVVASNQQDKTEVPSKPTKQTRLNFRKVKKAPEIKKLEAM